ncbi:hypothetical protein Tco_0731672 [Tanacetum coccineum]
MGGEATEEVSIIRDFQMSLQRIAWIPPDRQVEFQIDLVPVLLHCSRVPVHEEDIPKTALGMPFGLTNAPKVFMDLMNRKGHEGHLKLIEVLKQEGRCIHVVHTRFEYIIDWPMTKLTQKRVKFDWGEKAEVAFQLLKQKLCSARFCFTMGCKEVRLWLPAMLQQVLGCAFFEQKEKMLRTLSVWTEVCRVTDHKEFLTIHILDQKDLNIRQRLWLELLSDHDYEIRYHISQNGEWCLKPPLVSLSAQSEARKEENFINEDLHGRMVEWREPFKTLEDMLRLPIYRFGKGVVIGRSVDHYLCWVMLEIDGSLARDHPETTERRDRLKVCPTDLKPPEQLSRCSYYRFMSRFEGHACLRTFAIPWMKSNSTTNALH